MKNFFAHFETCNRQEREAIAAELIRMYNTAILNECELFAHGDAVAYAEQVGKLAMLQGVFDVLGIEFEPGQLIDTSI